MATPESPVSRISWQNKLSDLDDPKQTVLPTLMPYKPASPSDLQAILDKLISVKSAELASPLTTSDPERETHSAVPEELIAPEDLCDKDGFYSDHLIPAVMNEIQPTSLIVKSLIRIDELEKIVSEQTKAIKEKTKALEAKTKALEEKDEATTKLQTEIAEKDEATKKLQAEIVELKANILQLQSENESLKVKLNDFERTRDTILFLTTEKYKTNLKSMQAELLQSQVECERLLLALTAESNKYDAIYLERSHEKDEIKKNTDELHALRLKTKEQQDKITQLETEHKKELQIKDSSLGALQKTFAQYQARIIELAKQNEKLKAELERKAAAEKATINGLQSHFANQIRDKDAAEKAAIVELESRFAIQIKEKDAEISDLTAAIATERTKSAAAIVEKDKELETKRKFRKANKILKGNAKNTSDIVSQLRGELSELRKTTMEEISDTRKQMDKFSTFLSQLQLQTKDIAGKLLEKTQEVEQRSFLEKTQKEQIEDLTTRLAEKTTKLGKLHSLIPEIKTQIQDLATRLEAQIAENEILKNKLVPPPVDAAVADDDADGFLTKFEGRDLIHGLSA